MNELQAILNLISSALLGELASFLSPRLILTKDQTAATDGRTWVQLPREFLGCGMQEQMPVFIGLLAHEIGHWLQPLEEITEVEKKTGLNHNILNIILDVHLEHLVPIIFPLFSGPLQAVRDVVKTSNKEVYEKGYREAQDFLQAADFALLYGRFCLQPNLPFIRPDRWMQRKVNSNPHVDVARLQALTERVESVMTRSPGQLPEFVQNLAADFPELCQQEPSLGLNNPLDGLKSGGEGLTVVRGLLRDLKIGTGESSALIVESDTHGHCPPSSETSALSRQLCKRWEVSNSRGVIMAPGRLNRLSAVRGDPMPYSMAAGIRGKQAPQTKVILIVDWSGSMSVQQNAPWLAALQAAQAISLAIRSSGGDVRAAFFAENLWHAPGFSADVLFAAGLGQISLKLADGDDTDFSWLPHLWQSLPTHRVVLLTDGNGYPPKSVLPGDRKRTSAILLQVRRNDPANLAQIETTVSSFASTYVHVDQLSELAAAWALLIPRRFQ